MTSIKRDIIWRIYLAFFFVCLAGIAIVAQTINIQVAQGEHWRSLADSLTTGYRSIEAERGNVFSEDGSLLATSLPFFEVRVDLNSEAMKDELFKENIDSLSIAMARFFKDKTAAQYKRQLIQARRNGARYHLITRKVTYPDLQQIKSWPLFREGRYKGGLITIQHNKRVNPFRMLAHRTIGYVRDDVQPVGLEGQFDDYLSGVKGKRLMQKISGGYWVPINDDNEISPQNGNDIVTTLDVNLQDVAEHALLEAVRKHHADHGSVIVMEVKTGKIKAIANIGRMNDEMYWEKYNYAIGEGTEPGSTFKLAAMIALLEDGFVDLNDSVDLENGAKRYYDRIMRDSEEHDYGNVTVQQAFEISSNVGISKLVNRYYTHKPEAFVRHLENIGLKQPTGIEIKGESQPYIKSPDMKEWSGITLPWMAVGYEVQLAPIQILQLYNAVANDGRMMKPYLVNEIQEYGQTVKKFKPTVVKEKICSDATLQNVQLMLEGVVENGTARNLRTSNYSIAGKTGTSQIADKKHGYRKVYQSSFAGYFPADDPLYSCIVVINAPRSGVYYGSYVAGPVFREIADKVYSSNVDIHLALNRDETFYGNEVPRAKTGYAADVKTLYDALGISYSMPDETEWVYADVEDHSIALKERKIINGLVPNVVGMGLKDAVYLLENSGLEVRAVGKGKVRKQSLRIGSRVSRGEEIIIELG